MSFLRHTPSNQIQEIRTPCRPASGSDFSCMVEHRGVEPLTSTMRMSRATNCANAPYSIRSRTNPCSASSMVVIPHRGTHSLSLDLSADEASATGSRQRFALSSAMPRAANCANAPLSRKREYITGGRKKQGFVLAAPDTPGTPGVCDPELKPGIPVLQEPEALC